jgi:hypothetical protein
MFIFFAIAVPPETIKEPVVMLVESETPFILSKLKTLFP